MKQSLQLKFSQQLAMTPQLQQAIKLLQLSSLDLQQEIQEIAESNPLLDLAENTEDKVSIDSAPEADQKLSDKQEEWTADDQREAIDHDWPKTSNNTSSSSGGTASEFERGTSETLHDHLLWQLNLTPMSDRDKTIAIALLDAVGDNGILTQSLESITESLAESNEALETDEVHAVLHRHQHFDPPSVAAQNIEDCLVTQLNQYPSDTPWLQHAKTLIKRHLSLLGSHDYTTLMRRMRLKEPELKAVIELIQTLNPAPGDKFADPSSEYVVPDVVVKKYEGVWQVFLNNDQSRRLSINETYAGMIKRGDSSSDNQYLRDQLQEARWFIKSLESRNETLLKVANCIVEVQQDFFEHGEEAMKPLILQTVAEAIEMHESTVSRVTTQKYMMTPRGLFELKYFFSSHVGTTEGGECSSTAIRAMLKRAVAAENPKKPLSDSKLAQQLEEQGIKVARRTVAKYRESMNIPPSNERKRLV